MNVWVQLHAAQWRNASTTPEITLANVLLAMKVMDKHVKVISKTPDF